MGASGGVVNVHTLASLGDDEEAAEGEEGPAIGAAWIGGSDELGIGGFEAAALRFLAASGYVSDHLELPGQPMITGVPVTGRMRQDRA